MAPAVAEQTAPLVARVAVQGPTASGNVKVGEQQTG